MISKEEVQKLAELARLEISEGEVEALQKDISKILDYVGQVSAVPALEGRDSSVQNVMRPDTPREENDPLAHTRDAILAELPKREGDYALVRKIISKDE